jgi:hypothetical protein
MPKTLAQEQFEIKHANELEIAKRELTRRQLDIIRVYNPLDHAFTYMQDRYWFKVPAKSYQDIPRYRALHYFKKICDYMIGQQIEVKGKQLMELREKQMGHVFLDKYEENVEIWNKVPRLNDPDLVQAIWKTVIIGLVEEYGSDQPDEFGSQVEERSQDFRNMHEQMFDNLSKVSETVVASGPRLADLPPVSDPTIPLTADDAPEVVLPDAPILPKGKSKVSKASAAEITKND